MKMNWRAWLEKWQMSSLKITVPFLEMNWDPKDEDKDAAWELYIELLTRITTQPLDDSHGDEATALESVHKIFSLTREIIKRHGRKCIEFTKIAVVVLNQIIRPFTAKWHRVLELGQLKESDMSKDFRKELTELQSELRKYTMMLADMAGVENLTDLEKT